MHVTKITILTTFQYNLVALNVAVLLQLPKLSTTQAGLTAGLTSFLSSCLSFFMNAGVMGSHHCIQPPTAIPFSFGMCVIYCVCIMYYFCMSLYVNVCVLMPCMHMEVRGQLVESACSYHLYLGSKYLMSSGFHGKCLYLLSPFSGS